MVGIVPAFNTSYRWDAASMTAGQKMGLALRSMTDPFQFGAAFLVAGYHEAMDDDTGFGWGAEGFFKRSGAAYLDAFDGEIISNGILPSLLHQDPRYFRMGTGSVLRRTLHAITAIEVARMDSGRRTFNFSEWGGNSVAVAVSNAYYPDTRDWHDNLERLFVACGTDTFSNVLKEFWPDVKRKFQKHHDQDPLLSTGVR